MERNQHSVTFVEIAMAIVVFAIVAVVALPTLQFSDGKKIRTGSSLDASQATEKVKSAYERALDKAGSHPRLSSVVEYLDADFASERDDLGGIVFWGFKKRVTVKTYNDDKCKTKTSGEKPGVSDIVRCIDTGFDA